MTNQLLYPEILKQIIERDNISFKLLAFVPTVAGLVSFITLWKDAKDLPMLPFCLIGTFGALFTLFIWRWEERNIQFCKTLREAAANIELNRSAENLITCTPFASFDQSKKPKLLGLPMGKTEAERAIYILTIAFWLSLPFMANSIKAEAAVQAQQKTEQTK